MRTRAGRPAWAVLLLLAVALAAAASTSVAVGASLEGAVVRVVDGDTVHVRIGGRLEKVRYIGVNTPELHHPTKGEELGGREAARVNESLVAGRQV